MADEHTFLPAVLVEDLGDLVAELIFGRDGGGDAETDGHDFDGDDPDLVVGGFVARHGVDVGEEFDVGVEADADAVDEEDGEAVLGGVRAVPVGYGFGRAPVSGEETAWAEGENGEESGEGEPVKAKAVREHRDVGNIVDKPDTLLLLLAGRFPLSGCSKFTKYQIRLRCFILTRSSVSLVGLADPKPGANFLPSNCSTLSAYFSSSSSSSLSQSPLFKKPQQKNSLTFSRLISDKGAFMNHFERYFSTSATFP